MDIDVELLTDIKEYLKYRLTCFINYENYIHIAKYDHVINSRYCKVSRIKKRLVYLLTYTKYHYFVTFTFDNNIINKCDRTKRDLIKNTLNNFSADILYILNVDYGSQTEREHYHCIVGTNDDNDFNSYLKLTYPCFSHCQHIRLNSNDIKKVSKYINKLSNHCIKDSTKNKRIVYNFKGYDSITDINDRFYLFTKHKHKLGL